MTTRNIGPIVEELLRRVRQEGDLAVDVDFATRIYSYCEQCTNAYTRRVLSTATLTTPKQKLVYNFRDEITDAIEIIDIRESNRRIEHFNKLHQMSAYDINWFRNITGTRFETWTQLGRDILILYPGQAAASSVDVTYVKLLTLHTNHKAAYNTASELPDEDIEFALKLAEIMLLARFRQHKPLQRRLKTMFNFLKIK